MVLAPAWTWGLVYMTDNRKLALLGCKIGCFNVISGTERQNILFTFNLHTHRLFHDQIWRWGFSINEAPLVSLCSKEGDLWYRGCSEGAFQNPYPALNWVCKVSVCLRSQCRISSIMRTSWRHTPPDWPFPAQTAPTSSPLPPSQPYPG